VTTLRQKHIFLVELGSFAQILVQNVEGRIASLKPLSLNRRCILVRNDRRCAYLYFFGRVYF